MHDLVCLLNRFGSLGAVNATAYLQMKVADYYLLVHFRFCASLYSLSMIRSGLPFLAHMSTGDKSRGDVVCLMPFT